MAQYLTVQRIENGFPAARRMQRIVNALMDLPVRGVIHGDTGKLTIAATVPDPCPEVGFIGWTTRWRRWHRHPLNDGSATDRWALLITDDLRAAWLAKRAQIPLAVRQWVQAHVDTAADLAAEWFPQTDDGPQLDSSDDILPEQTP